MRNPFLKIYMLMEGRSMRLPLTILFYNSILSLVMLIFLFLNSETVQEGLYYDTSSYLHQFLILSSIQFAVVFLTMPFYVSGLFAGDRENHMIEQFDKLPGVNRQFVGAKISIVMMTNGLLFLSGVPVVGLACIYTGLGWLKVIRLGFMVLLFAFWAGAIAIFFYSISNRLVWSFAGTITAESLFIVGTLLLIELFRNLSLMPAGVKDVPPEVAWVCLFLLTLNPLTSYMGYYGNITGDNGLIMYYCSHFGIDASGSLFSLLFYKVSGLVCFLTGVLMLSLAIRYLNKKPLK